MLSKKIMILAIFLVSLLVVSAVSAEDNSTSDIVEAKEVDNNVTSSLDENIIKAEPDTFATLNDTINGNDDSDVYLDRNYSLEVDSSFADGIVINRPVTIHGNGFTIDGQNLARVFQVTGSNVILEDISFVNGATADKGGALNWSGNGGSISNCNFTNCSAGNSGGAIENNGANCTISSCNFNGDSSRNGGAIYNIGTNCSIISCDFADCSATSYGAIYNAVLDCSISACNFTDCYATLYYGTIGSWGGSCDISSCNFNNCSGSNGDAIYLTSDRSSITSCNFTNCNIKKDSVVYLDNFQYKVSDCNFNNCVDLLYLHYTLNNVISCCNFTNSSGISGSFSNDTIIDHCNFRDCSADDGGAIYMMGVDTNITCCNFTNCSASARGGAICLYGVDDAAYNCVFEDCHANGGGAVCNGTVVNCLFKNNYAKNGGATYYTDAVKCTFVNNRATDYGGAMFNGTAIDCKFLNNTAGIDGNDYYNGSSSKPSDIVPKTTPVKNVVKLTLKKVKIKRSAKKLVIRATLKINGKAVKGKKITFKFKGKKYRAKTNKNGVAKITINRKVLKRLKVGKKVKYQATYGQVTKKYTVKVKK